MEEKPKLEEAVIGIDKLFDRLSFLKEELASRDKTIADQAKEIEELKIACKWKQTQIEDLLNQQKDNSPF